MIKRWGSAGLALALALLAAGCGDDPSLTGTWIMADNQSRTMTVRDDGSVSANIDVPCTGTTKDQGDREYRLELDCGITKISADGVLSTDGSTLTVKDPSTGQDAVWNRK
ncbi:MULTISPECIES: hypothetical protein [Micromonospora]|uniref:Lipoprotein n=1 Tax=Micromonospora lupini str. Lupac 08 TaxID=1150864 RepID=I0L2W0_9ACTN|nr:hypothetical protein [Micromonospora lupini]CCH18157.1 conserved exported hypothetical protein [Micromonospora lupini str. Lupac 08]